MASTENTPLNASSTSDDASASAAGPNYLTLSAIVTLMLAIGTGLAFATLYVDENKLTYESKILALKAQDLQWLYLALVVLGRMISIVNFAPTVYKSHLKGNIRSNPFFFQTDDTKKTMVLFQEDGTNGMYNRSNRSVQHMVENFGAFLASIGPVGYIFPKQTFGVVTVFSLGRILHQKGYTKGYGSHALGFVLATLSILMVEGLALITFLKAEEIIV